MTDTDKFIVRRTITTETRHKILTELIKNGAMAVQSIADAIGQTHSSTSHQLAPMVMNDILVSEKDGRLVIYSFAKTPEAKYAKKIMAA